MLKDYLRKLGEKYAVTIPADWEPEKMPLLPWRQERRFVELKNLVTEPTVENVVMCRFSCNTTPEFATLEEILYRELDLCEFLVGSEIAGLYAAITTAAGGARFANLLVRLANGVVCSVEAGTTLKKGSVRPILDRHEMIGRRGVASDRVVDTHVPQDSVYVYTDAGTTIFTDTDSELFGLSNEEINQVRAAFALAKNPELQDFTRLQDKRLKEWVALAFVSDEQKKYLTLEGGNA
ncbi:MAG: hypothetical protein Q4D98_00410 [Planctomycetia bacterium]|nr:hypothetical protein [Planctomycetia bacterium]